MTIAELRISRPDVAISVEREIDTYAFWNEKEFDGPKPDGVYPYTFTVTAATIRNGTMYTGQGTLSASWCAADEQDDDIHGYLPDMIDEALGELDKKLAAL